MLPNSTLTSAASVKSPAGGKPTNRPASGNCSRSVPAGSMNRSVPAAAISVSTPCRTRHPDGGLPAGSSGNGRLGNFHAVTWVVCHGMRRLTSAPGPDARGRPPGAAPQRDPVRPAVQRPTGLLAPAAPASITQRPQLSITQRPQLSITQRPRRRLHQGLIRQVPGLKLVAQPVYLAEDLAAQGPALGAFGGIGTEQVGQPVLLVLRLLQVVF